MPEADRALRALVEVRDRMLDNPSGSARAAAAALVAGEFSSGRLVGQERSLALALLETLAADVEKRVRETLAEHVKSCPFLPQSLVKTLVEDVASVAVPVIRTSPLLSEAELVALVRQGDVMKQLAVAQRARVTAPVAASLATHGDRRVIGRLLDNSGAELAENTLHEVLDRFGGDDDMHARLIERPLLPLTVTERLIRMTSEALRDRLIERHGIPPELADELTAQGGEGVLAQRLVSEHSALDVELLAARLHARGRLTATFVLRALCLGDCHFFEVAMAMLAAIPFENAATLIYDPGRRGFKALYDKAQLPPELFDTFQAGIDFVKEVKLERGEAWGVEHSRQLLRRIAGGLGEGCPVGLEALINQLSARIFGRSDGAQRLH